MAKILVVASVTIAPLLVAIAAGGSASGAKKTIESPVITLLLFFGHLEEKSIEEAAALIEAPAGLREPVAGELKRFAGRKGPRILAHLQLDRAAVVIIHEGGNDLDPAYAVRRKEGWKVLHELTSFDRRGFSFDERTMEEFRALEAWYREQKRPLQQLLAKRR